MTNRDLIDALRAFLERLESGSESAQAVFEELGEFMTAGHNPLPQPGEDTAALLEEAKQLTAKIDAALRVAGVDDLAR